MSNFACNDIFVLNCWAKAHHDGTLEGCMNRGQTSPPSSKSVIMRHDPENKSALTV